MKNQLKRIIGTHTILDVYDFEEFQKLKINKFEVELGYDTITKYFYDDENNDDYGNEVSIEDYKGYGLIDQKIFDKETIINFTKATMNLFIQLLQKVKSDQNIDIKFTENWVSERC